jgi:hypothetical protein
MEELWTFLGNGTMAYPVQVDMSLSVCGFSSVNPTFKAMSEATDLEALQALPLPLAVEVRADDMLKFQGKLMIGMPPLLRTFPMEADTKDLLKLLQVVCKALNDYEKPMGDCAT